jgi:hypothetical protein
MNAPGGLILWTKIGADGGQSLEAILARREWERRNGDGVFWWAIGNNYASSICGAARSLVGNMPVLFSKLRGKPHGRDANPEHIFIWRHWKDYHGQTHEIPQYIRLWSVKKPKLEHYALVCRSDSPIALGDHGPFDEKRCVTYPKGKVPGTSMVTVLLRTDGSESTSCERYRIAFCACLVEPWCVRLTCPREMTASERTEFAKWPLGSSGWESVQEPTW